jgi:hypothetical protein
MALTPSLGVIGVCLGVLGGRLVQTIAHPLLVDRSLRRSPRLPTRSIARPLAVMVLVFALTAVLGDRLLATNWVTWAAGVSVSLVVMLGVALVGLPAEGRRAVLGRWREIVATTRG